VVSCNIYRHSRYITCAKGKNWVLPIACEDGNKTEFTKLSEDTVLPKQADVVELGGEARFSVTVGDVWQLGFTPLVRCNSCSATRQQIDWLRLNGWVEK